MSSKRALVTGGLGFIGSHMVNGLVRRKYSVTVVDSKPADIYHSPSNTTVKYIQADLEDPKGFDKAFEQKFDVVFHLAGRASLIGASSEPERDIKPNIIGTVNVIKKCIQYRIPRLLYASSASVYGDASQTPIPETEPCVPTSYYGITKYAAERYVHVTSERPDLDFPFAVTSFRLFNVYGEGQSLTNPYQGVVGIFLGKLLRGEPLTIFSNGKQTRDFVYVGDVANAWIMAIDQKETFGKIFNIGSGEEHTVEEVARILQASISQFKAKNPTIYSSAELGGAQKSVADISRITRTLGWKPKTSFTEGISRTVEWARNLGPHDLYV